MAMRLEPFAAVCPLGKTTMKEYFCRVSACPVAGVKWNLEDCAKKYGLSRKYDIDMGEAHTAGFDACWLVLTDHCKGKVLCVILSI